MAKHADLAVGSIHIPYQWTYANAAARTGAGGFVSGDVGKFARQTDDNSIWMLTATTPTWTQVNSTASGAPTDASYVTLNAEAGLSAETPHPELYDPNSAGTPVDLSSPNTGTGVSASVSNGLTLVTFSNNSWQYWDVASAIGTGNFDVRCRLLDLQVTTYASAYQAMLDFTVMDSSRTASTRLAVERLSACPNTYRNISICGQINGGAIGQLWYEARMPVILRIARSGTTVTFYFSVNEGRNWVTLGSTTSSLNIAYIGLMLHANTQTGCSALVHWIRSF